MQLPLLALAALPLAAPLQGGAPAPYQWFPGEVDIAASGPAGAWYGASVAVRGGVAAVVSRNGSLLRVFEQGADGAWAQVPTAVAPGAWDRGVAVGDGEVLVGRAGEVLHLERQPGGAWVTAGAILPTDFAATSEFGREVELDGDRLFVADPDVPPLAGDYGGAVAVFERPPGGAFVQVATLRPPVEALLGAPYGGSFGSALAHDADRVVVGDALWPDASFAIGVAHVYEYDGGAWLHAATLEGNGGDYPQFGGAADLRGDLALVGARYGNGAVYASGAGFAFRRDAGGAWALEQVLAHPDHAFGAQLGAAVALLGSDAALVGAAGEGELVVFRRDAGGTWGVEAELPAPASPPGATTGGFGGALAVDAQRVVVGAPDTDLASGGQNVGAVQFWTVCVECAVPYGAGTPGCAGPHAIAATQPAAVGGALVLTGSAAPANGVGLLGVSTHADAAGSDPFGLGASLHLDLLPPAAWAAFPVKSDAAGAWQRKLAVPDDPSFAGEVLFAQALWAWPACATPVSSTPGVALVVLGG